MSIKSMAAINTTFNKSNLFDERDSFNYSQQDSDFVESRVDFIHLSKGGESRLRQLCSTGPLR